MQGGDAWRPGPPRAGNAAESGTAAILARDLLVLGAVMKAKSAEPKRTRASLSGELSDFLIELSAALQKHAMYPPGHPVLGPSAESVFSRLSVLLASHGSLSIGVAREQLIIEGVATDSTHALAP